MYRQVTKQINSKSSVEPTLNYLLTMLKYEKEKQYNEEFVHNRSLISIECFN